MMFFFLNQSLLLASDPAIRADSPPNVCPPIHVVSKLETCKHRGSDKPRRTEMIRNKTLKKETLHELPLLAVLLGTRSY